MSHHVPHMHRRHDDPPMDPPPSMSAEQLEFFTHQTERAVNKAHQMALAADRKRGNARIAGFAILFVAFLGNVWYSNHLTQASRDKIVLTGDIVAVDGCNRDYEDRVAIRRVLLASKEFTQNAFRRLALTEEEKQLRLDFYDEQLERLPLPDCRNADDVLTDDPDVPVRFPEAKYPGKAKAEADRYKGLVPPVPPERDKKTE